MMLDPVENRSDRVTNRNCALDQITNSSAKRLRCMAEIDATDRNSIAKSRAETASNELAIGRSKPKLSAVICRSIGKPVPASAAAPKGDSFIRARASRTRDRSRANIST